MADKMTLFEAHKHRRTYYGVAAESPISDERIKEICLRVVKDTPSAYNTQSSRMVLVLKEDNVKLWKVLTDAAEKALGPGSHFDNTKGRFEGFGKAYGTVLFFEDTDTIKHAREVQFPQLGDTWEQFSEHTNAMHQIVLWMALEAEGLGANNQHNNKPHYRDAVTEAFNLPKTWSLKAQLNFGKPTSGPALDPKTFKPLEGERFFYFNGNGKQ